MARIIARATCTLVSPFAALLRPAPRPWIELFVAQFDAANLLCRPRNEARGPAFAKTEFATDSPLEGDGFELPVPPGIGGSPSWWSRTRKPHGAPELGFIDGGTRSSNPPPSSGEMLCGGRRGWQFRRLHQSMECRDASAERFEQVPRRPGPRQHDHCRGRDEPVELAGWRCASRH